MALRGHFYWVRVCVLVRPLHPKVEKIVRIIKITVYFL
ncbi:hypothetical protein O23A_p1261 [Aeromonas salmonicida]|nr:hypothetical protein O23A_p1261 [Aeromonas salmonicida]